MSIKFGAFSVIGLAIVGLAGYSAYSHSSLKKSFAHQVEINQGLIEKLNERETVIKAYVEQAKTNEELIKGRDNANTIYLRTVAANNELRKSINSLQARTSNSLEACNRSYSLAGELLGTCGDRYSDVARKAELLKQDAIALDKDSDMLRGLVSGLKPLGTLGTPNGN